MERNSLMQHTYPKLKEYCREKHGLEFQVVDMRWGVRDEATDDHKTTELCMQEIDNCQRVSVGPNFVVRSCTSKGSRYLSSRLGLSRSKVRLPTVADEDRRRRISHDSLRVEQRRCSPAESMVQTRFEQHPESILLATGQFDLREFHQQGASTPDGRRSEPMVGDHG